MHDPSILDVLTVPGYRTGPSVLGLAILSLLFSVPGYLAPIFVLQVVGAVWLLAAIITAGRDVLHVRNAQKP